jgi:hypothetical protein
LAGPGKPVAIESIIRRYWSRLAAARKLPSPA